MKTNEESSTPSNIAKYKRIVLKISGEALGAGEHGESIDHKTLVDLCKAIHGVYNSGVQIGLVVGGGNIFRGLAGAKEGGTERSTGDYMGMLATVINGLAMMDQLEKCEVPVRVQSAIPMSKIAEPFILRRAIRHMEKGRVVLFVAGTGNPYFSTDTTAALRASEIGADVLLKATNVDGVYDKDPAKHADAKKYDQVTYDEAMHQRLNIMDSTAFSLCMDNHVPIYVFNMTDPENIIRAVGGKSIGTLVHGSNSDA